MGIAGCIANVLQRCGTGSGGEGGGTPPGGDGPNPAGSILTLTPNPAPFVFGDPGTVRFTVTGGGVDAATTVWYRTQSVGGKWWQMDDPSSLRVVDPSNIDVDTWPMNSGAVEWYAAVTGGPTQMATLTYTQGAE